MKSTTNKFFLLLMISWISGSSAQNNFIGYWQNEDKTIVMQLYQQNSEYYAKVIANASETQSIILIQMKKKSDKRLFGGTFYNPILKSENEARLKLTDENTIRMSVLSGLFNNIILWHRVRLDYDQKTNRTLVLQH